jgi:eukaryotic-like serine/threonine-protein kinase
MAEDAGRTRRLGAEQIFAPASSEPPSHHVGEWTILRSLARGGFATVFEAHRERDGRMAACKLLHASLAGCAESVARFRREADVLARLRHPNIVELLDSGVTADGRPYLCMELIAGTDLAAFADARGPLPAADVLAIVEPLCDALAVAHAQGVIHRDVKAANVMLAPATGGAGSRLGRPVLLDFGIAKLLDGLALDLTSSRQAVGTPACMSPEQIRGGAIDARTDIYGLGGLVFHLLAGRMPFSDPSITVLQYLHLHARRPRPSRFAAVPTAVDAVIERAMAIDPGARFDSPRTLLAALRAGLRDTAITPVVREEETAAILVSVADRTRGAGLDGHLLDDREAVLLLAERALAAAGWQLAMDLGASALFVSACDRAAALAAALQLAAALDARPGRDRRVDVGIRVHRAIALFVGDELQTGVLAHPETWGTPDDEPGVFASAAALIDRRPDELYRRMR